MQVNVSSPSVHFSTYEFRLHSPRSLGFQYSLSLCLAHFYLGSKVAVPCALDPIFLPRPKPEDSAIQENSGYQVRYENRVCAPGLECYSEARWKALDVIESFYPSRCHHPCLIRLRDLSLPPHRIKKRRPQNSRKIALFLHICASHLAQQSSDV